jgi:hypothetical protein
MLAYSAICDRVAAAYAVPPTVQVDDDIRASIAAFGDETWVFIPGTTDFAGWRDDFSAVPWPFPAVGWCHEGFAAKGLELWRGIAPRLPATGRLGIGGHSLGGGLAQICAAMNAYEGRSPCRLVTFGSPRVAALWNVALGRLIGAALEAVGFEHRGDPVPDVPTLPPFKHVIRRRTIGKPLGFPLSTADHALALYARDLRAEHS